MFNSVYAWEMASCFLRGWVTRLVLQLLKSPRFENCPTIGAASSRPSHGSQERRAMRGDERKTAHLGPRLSPLGQFRGLPLGQLHSGCSGVNKRNISHNPAHPDVTQCRLFSKCCCWRGGVSIREIWVMGGAS